MMVRDSDGQVDWQAQRRALNRQLPAAGGPRVRAEELDPETWGTLPGHQAAEAGLLDLGGTDDAEAPIVP